MSGTQAADAKPQGEEAPAARRAVKVTVNVREQLAAALRDYADQSGKTFTQALQEAIYLKLFVEDLRTKDATLVILHPDGSTERIVFYGP